MKGGSTDGNRYVEKAIAAGRLGHYHRLRAEPSTTLLVYQTGLPVLEVEHGRRALAQAAAAFFGHPERKLAATGITGTNGKTTTAYLADALLNAAARNTVLVGTIEYHVAGEVRPSVHTTPESSDLFELMAEGVARGATELVTEVSSHALDQGRDDRRSTSTWPSSPTSPATTSTITGRWRTTSPPSGCSSTARCIRRRAWPSSTRTTRAASSWPRPRAGRAPRSAPTASGRATGAPPATRSRASGAEFELETPAGTAQVTSRLAGEVNILNLLAALAAAHARGVPFADLVESVPRLRPVPGRFQSVDAGQPFTVIVDYAHTDDALINLTALARQMTAKSGGRVITLFGCGGDRDRTKRPKMGLAAGDGKRLCGGYQRQSALRGAAGHSGRD